MSSITKQDSLLDQLDTLARRFAERAAGFRMAGERDKAMAHDRVAAEARYAADRLKATLAKAASAAPMPERVVRIATLADGQPAYARRSVA